MIRRTASHLRVPAGVSVCGGGRAIARSAGVPDCGRITGGMIRYVPEGLTHLLWVFRDGHRRQIAWRTEACRRIRIRLVS